MRVNVDIINRQRKIKISSERLSATVRKVIEFLHRSGELKKIKTEIYQIITLSVVLVGQKKMKEINFKYRGKNYVTDVLSFSYLDNENISEETYLGEILINPEKAKLQAKQYKVSMWQEINRLLTHGILHLLGYDHEISANHEKKMRKLEEKILKNL